MSRIWPSVTRDNPCPVCGKEDWCLIGDKVIACMRVESPHPAKCGGWYHSLEEKVIKPLLRHAEKRPAAPSINATAIMHSLATKTYDIQRWQYADDLGVSPEAIVTIQAAWSRAYNAWAFPMRDGNSEIIGVRLRDASGKKWAIPGSRNGIFIPQFSIPVKTAFIVEGPTDTAAAVSLNLFAIGKPSCNAGDDHVKTALRRLGIKRVVIVSDNDGPGQQGAAKLKSSLTIPAVIWTPPAKDLRAFLIAGGTGAMVENSISKLLWK